MFSQGLLCNDDLNWKDWRAWMGQPLPSYGNLRAWWEWPLFKVYLRRTRRLLPGSKRAITTIDVSSWDTSDALSIGWPGDPPKTEEEYRNRIRMGLAFWRWLQALPTIARETGHGAVYIENVVTPEHIPIYRRFGYLYLSGEGLNPRFAAPCFYLLLKA